MAVLDAWSVEEEVVWDVSLVLVPVVDGSVEEEVVWDVSLVLVPVVDEDRFTSDVDIIAIEVSEVSTTVKLDIWSVIQVVEVEDSSVELAIVVKTDVVVSPGTSWQTHNRVPNKRR